MLFTPKKQQNLNEILSKNKRKKKAFFSLNLFTESTVNKYVNKKNRTKKIRKNCQKVKKIYVL